MKSALLAILRSHARSLDLVDPDQGLRCHKLIGYVTNNRRGITNYRIMPLASSGPMEKGVDISICRRFKSRGMELVPPGREPPAPSQAAAPQRLLGPLLGGTSGGGSSALAGCCLTASTED